MMLWWKSYYFTSRGSSNIAIEPSLPFLDLGSSIIIFYSGL
jgi:hypothetical protein